MKIIKVETFDVRWPLDRLRSDAINSTDAWGFAVVRLTCEDGTVGTGYTGTARGVGNSLILAAIQENYASVLLGSEASNIRGLWKRMYWSPLHWCGRAGISQMALSAVDIALWDIAARKAGLPLCDYLGSEEPTKFPAYNTSGGWASFTLRELLDNAKESVDAGFGGVKIKLGLPEGSEDLRRIGALRDELGDSVDIMTDVNQAWGISDALRWGQRLADHGVKWLEEPMDPEDWRAHARLAGAIATPLALGEHLYSAHAFDDFIDASAVLYVQPDATRVGGVTEFLRVAELAAVRGLPLCPHAGDMMQVHQHLIFAAKTAHVFEHIPWGADLFVDPAVVRGGKVQRPTAPGAGTAMFDEAIARYLVGRPGVSEA